MPFDPMQSDRDSPARHRPGSMMNGTSLYGHLHAIFVLLLASLGHQLDMRKLRCRDIYSGRLAGCPVPRTYASQREGRRPCYILRNRCPAMDPVGQ